VQIQGFATHKQAHRGSSIPLEEAAMLIDQNEYLELKALLADEESEVRLSRPFFFSLSPTHTRTFATPLFLVLFRTRTRTLTLATHLLTGSHLVSMYVFVEFVCVPYPSRMA